MLFTFNVVIMNTGCTHMKCLEYLIPVFDRCISTRTDANIYITETLGEAG